MAVPLESMPPASGESYYDTTIYSGLTPDGDAADGGGAHALDSPAHQKDYRQLWDWWTQARIIQAPARYEMALDDDFYDGLQWSPEDQAEVERRGQAALTFNQIKPVIDWMIGTERRARINFRAFPRSEEDRVPAEIKTKLLKYTDDVNSTQFHRSRAFGETCRVGVGWLEDGIRADPSKEPIYSRMESWRNIWYDHLATDPGLDDARYMFRSKTLDIDVAVALIPSRAGQLRAAANVNEHIVNPDDDGDETFLSQLYHRVDSQGRSVGQRSYMQDTQFAFTNRRARVRVVEGWYRKPVAGKVLITPDGRSPIHGAIFDPQDPAHAALTGSGGASLVDALRLQMWCALFIEGCLLQNMPSPYRHDQFPFTPIWAYRRKRDGTPYGPIRNQRDPQEDLNKRRSKALHILNTAQVVAEEGAVADKEEAREEVAAPDGYIEVRKDKRFDIIRDNALSREHIELEARNKEYIREIGGVTTENLGHQTNAKSGVAIEARQNEGAVVTTELYDNLAFATQLQGHKRLSLIEQYYDAPKVVRLIGPHAAQEFIRINQVSGVDAATNAPIVENDITASKADFVVDREDYRVSIRQAMFEQLSEMVAKLPPEIGLQLLDLVVDLTDVPNKDTIVARIRKLNGQMDPSKEGTPEALAAQQAEQQAQAARQALEQRLISAEVADKESGAALKKQQAVAQAVEMIGAAAQTGKELLITPQVAVMLDEILQFVNATIQSPPPPQQPANQPMAVPPAAGM